MKLVCNKSIIRKRRFFKKLKLRFIGKTKKVNIKLSLLNIFPIPFLKKKFFILSKKKKLFNKRNLTLKSYMLRKVLELFCKKNTLNIIIPIKNKNEYVQIKAETGFCNLEKLKFKFWHLKKKWIEKLFKKNLDLGQISKVLNGSMLVVKLKSLVDIIKLLDIIETKSFICCGVYIYNKIYWPNYFLESVFNIIKNLNVISLVMLSVSIIPTVILFLSNVKNVLNLGIKSYLKEII